MASKKILVQVWPHFYKSSGEEYVRYRTYQIPCGQTLPHYLSTRNKISGEGVLVSNAPFEPFLVHSGRSWLQPEPTDP
jgi:hypothetical protein